MHLLRSLPIRIDYASVRVVRAIMGRPRTAVQIAAATGVPVSAVFRRIRRLKALGVLREESRVMDLQGREAALYVCTFRHGTIFVEGDRARVNLSMDAGAPETSLESLL